jgi:hypothetical protein
MNLKHVTLAADIALECFRFYRKYERSQSGPALMRRPRGGPAIAGIAVSENNTSSALTLQQMPFKFRKKRVVWRNRVCEFKA